MIRPGNSFVLFLLWQKRPLVFEQYVNFIIKFSDILVLHLIDPSLTVGGFRFPTGGAVYALA